jgi:2-keto-3-deoxy-L-rhamnonate aldolase RhmA
MMAANSLRKRILSREPLLGCFLSWPTDGLAELLALTGFDFVVLDTEHGHYNPESVERMVRAADAAAVPAIVRVSNCQAFAEAGRALDAGAAGTLFPRADGAPVVRGAVESVKYAPPGKRGLAGVRANRYGTVPFDHWVLEANASTAVVIQIETAGALNAVAAIAEETWVDLLFVGPNDLSQALGVPGHYDDPRYVAALEKVGSVAREAGKAAGIMLRTADQIPGLSAMGYTMFTTSDRSLFMQSAKTWRGALARGQ